MKYVPIRNPEQVFRRLCFYCNRENPDKVYGSNNGAKIDVHFQCVSPLRKQLGSEIYEVRK